MESCHIPPSVMLPCGKEMRDREFQQRLIPICPIVTSRCSYHQEHPESDVVEHGGCHDTGHRSDTIVDDRDMSSALSNSGAAA